MLSKLLEAFIQTDFPNFSNLLLVQLHCIDLVDIFVENSLNINWVVFSFASHLNILKNTLFWAQVTQKTDIFTKLLGP